MRKLMMLAAMLAVAMLAASPALAQDEPAVVADAKAKTATAGGAKAEADCTDELIEAKAGGVVAKAPCKPAPPPPKAAPAPPPPKAAPAPAPPPPPKAAPAPAPPPPKAAPAPAPKKALPPTGGSSAASLFALGAGALLVGGGLVARRFIR
jgi:LPXTG-motif cell wall-anchored protein